MYLQENYAMEIIKNDGI